MRADDFGMVARHWRSIADDELSKLDAREIHERRNLHVHQSLFGMGVLDGDLDAEGTEILLKALDHCAPPGRDRRSRAAPVVGATARRRARRHLRRLPQRQCRGHRAGQPQRDHGPRHPHRAPPADPRQVRCELEGFGPIPLATAFRLACDCSVTRVLMRGDSEVLDLGRSTRLVSRAAQSVGDPRPRLCVPRL